MRYITHCPACETQFFVTDEQLNQHEGKVRCGQCLHVFNARQQIIEPEQAAPPSSEQGEVQHATTIQPDTPFNADETGDSQTIPVALDEPFLIEPEASPQTYTPSHLDDFLDKTKLKKSRKPLNKWLWIIAIILFVLFAIAQATYFLRNEIAIYYPAAKPYLTKACEVLQCRVELPKKIELIVVDDSDIQEDAERQGLIWLSSTLINQARFPQALPNLELTLTDVEDQPKLRKIITPAEYMPQDREVQQGLAANEEIRIRLPIDIKSEVLAGYRILVIY
jgi:predicted Zn finger-like uncharacterized protein